MAGVKIDSSHSRYAEIFAAWEENGYPSQFDMILYNENGDAEGGAIFRARQMGDDVIFWMSASERSTYIDNENDRPIRPHWSFASVRYRGLFIRRRRNQAPKIRYEKLVNNLILE
jgi:hypothetical protein